MFGVNRKTQLIFCLFLTLQTFLDHCIAENFENIYVYANGEESITVSTMVNELYWNVKFL